jgi:hypothetical protein
MGSIRSLRSAVAIPPAKLPLMVHPQIFACLGMVVGLYLITVPHFVSKRCHRLGCPTNLKFVEQELERYVALQSK